MVKEGGTSPEKEWLHSPSNWPYSVVESTLTIDAALGWVNLMEHPHLFSAQHFLSSPPHSPLSLLSRHPSV